jgi:hypothetical protein
MGIRKALKRLFSVEGIATAVERKIASDMARDPSNPRNVVGGTLIGAVQSVREQAVARRELEGMVRDHNTRAEQLAADVKAFNSQTPEWRAAHPEIRSYLEARYAALTKDGEQIKELSGRVMGAELQPKQIYCSPK